MGSPVAEMSDRSSDPDEADDPVVLAVLPGDRFQELVVICAPALVTAPSGHVEARGLQRVAIGIELGRVTPHCLGDADIDIDGRGPGPEVQGVIFLDVRYPGDPEFITMRVVPVVGGGVHGVEGRHLRLADLFPVGGDPLKLGDPL